MSVGCVVLAAGFGTRLRASLEASEEHRHLLEVPKPLLPLAGTTIAESWAAEMGQQGKVVLVSNARDAPRYAALFGDKEYGGRQVEVVDDGAMSNETRLGAVGDLALAVERLGDAEVFVAVAGDTLLDPASPSLAQLVQMLQEEDDALTLGYVMSDPARQCSSRGCLVLDGEGRVAQFVEKPAVPPANCLASAPLYVFRRRAAREMAAMLAEHRQKASPIAAYDAPGLLVARWVEKGMKVRCAEIPSRIDIGTLQDYLEAMEVMAKRR